MFYKKESNTEKDLLAIEHAKLKKDLVLLEIDAKYKIEEYEKVIVHLEKSIMDHNDSDEADENRRIGLRPLTNELMNQLKIDRNLTKYILHEVTLYQSATKITEQIYNRCAKRLNSANKELIETAQKIKTLIAELIVVCPDIILGGQAPNANSKDTPK